MSSILNKVYNEETNPFSLLSCSLGMLSVAKLITFVLLWLKEYPCKCNIKKKDFFSVICKFTCNMKELGLYGVFSVLSPAFYLYYGPNIEITHLAVGTIIIAVFFLFQEPNAIEISSILENNNINIGCGAAQQYFYGYLKMIMSAETNGWRERIQNYRRRHGVDIYSKLIILLPESCQSRSLLIDELCVPEIRLASPLDPLIVNKSGIERIFDSTVYVIDEQIWFVAEYVPPLTTFCKMLDSGTGHVFTADDKREQYILFCQHLKKLIDQDVDCADKCLFVQYDDKKEQSLTQLLLKRIEEDGLQMGRAAG
ncbi:stimulator of interferon genes protein-like isoform X2 [Centruroides vittatus]